MRVAAGLAILFIALGVESRPQQLRHGRRRSSWVKPAVPQGSNEFMCSTASSIEGGAAHRCQPSLASIASLASREESNKPLPSFYMHLSDNFDFTKMMSCFWAAAKRDESAADLPMLQSAT